MAGLSIDVVEPEEQANIVSGVGTRCKYEDLNAFEKQFHDQLKERGHVFTVPEFVRRVLALACNLNKTEKRFSIWENMVKFSSLGDRGIHPKKYKDENDRNTYDKYGRLNVLYTDDDGIEKISHKNQPYLILYCFANKGIYTKKASKAEVEAPF